MKQITLLDVTTYLEQHPHTTAKALACHFGYSQFHFSRWFKAQMGVSLRDYLSASKVERGVQALLENQSVIHAQLEAGYESSGTFSNHVKKLTGLLPKRYRESLLDFAKQVTDIDFSNYKNEVLYQPYAVHEHAQSHALQVSIYHQSHPDSLLFLACFPRAVAKEVPVLGVCLKGKHQFEITHIPNGSYYVMVIELVPHKSPWHMMSLNSCLRCKHPEPITFPLAYPQQLDLCLQHKQPTDPPIAVHPLKLLFDIVPTSMRSAPYNDNTAT